MFFGFGFVWFRVVFVFAMVHHIINTGHTLPPLTHKIGSRKKNTCGGGTQRTFVRGGSAPSSNYLFIYHFLRKRYSFPIPSIEKWYPFTYLV